LQQNYPNPFDSTTTISFTLPAKAMVSLRVFDALRGFLLVENNTIRDTGPATQKAAIFMAKNALPVTLRGNKMSGHPQGDVIYEK